MFSMNSFKSLLASIFTTNLQPVARPGTRQRRYRAGATGKQKRNPAGTKLLKKAANGTLTKCH